MPCDSFSHLCRFNDAVLEHPAYFPMWAHHLKSEALYEECALKNGRCRGQYGNHMPKFEGISSITGELISSSRKRQLFATITEETTSITGEQISSATMKKWRKKSATFTDVLIVITWVTVLYSFYL